MASVEHRDGGVRSERPHERDVGSREHRATATVRNGHTPDHFVSGMKRNDERWSQVIGPARRSV